MTSVTAVIGVIITYLKFRKEREEWTKEFNSKIVELESVILQKKIEERLKTYPNVFEVLGIVPDFTSVKLTKKQLKETADKILKHIYDPAGLVMQMETRNALIFVWEICEEFQNKEYDLDQLKDVFYYARRYLRADLQLDDIEEINSEWKTMMKKLKIEKTEKKGH